jgi:hypothetical protein
LVSVHKDDLRSVPGVSQAKPISYAEPNTRPRVYPSVLGRGIEYRTGRAGGHGAGDE